MSIKSNLKDNPGGIIRTLKIISPALITNAFDDFKGKLTNPAIAAYAWEEIDFTQFEIGYQQERINSNGSHIYKKTILGDVPKPSYEIEQILNKYHNKRCVVWITSRAKEQIIIGTKINPAVLTFDRDTGRSFGDRNIYVLSILQTSRKAALYYLPYTP
jgi:hypothetical protein